MDMKMKQSRYSRFFVLTALASLWLVPFPVSAVEVTSLYTAEVPYDARSSDGRSDAYRLALREVIERVTNAGQGNVDSIVSRFPNPAQYVMQFRPGDNDTLIVSLDGDAIERILRQTGETVWSRDRPLTLVWLAVDWGGGEREIIGNDASDRGSEEGGSIDRNRQLRERIRETAGRRGLPLVFPLLDSQDLGEIEFSDVWGGFDERLREASRRYQANSILIGRIRADSAQQNRWTWFLGEERRELRGEPEAVLGQVGNAMAAKYSYDGNKALESVFLTISGIDSVAAYGRVQRFLENLSAIDDLRLESAQSDRLIYDIRIRGGEQRLIEMLQTSRVLEPFSTSFGGNRSDRSRRDSNSAGPPRDPRFEDAPPAVVSRTVGLQYRYRAN